MSKRKWLAGAALTGAIALSLAVWNQRATHAGIMLPKVLPGEERYFLWKHGYVYYTKAGQGTPLLLLHGIGAGASSFEWHKLVPLLTTHYEVYTVDLPGFGKSEKPKVTYDSLLYAQFISDFLTEVVQQPSHIVTSSLSGAFALKSTVQQPANTLSITMISPSGMRTLNKQNEKKVTLLQKVLDSPVIGTTFYNSMATKATIRYRLKKYLYHNKQLVTPAVVDHYFHAAHQDGIQARRAPVSFLSGMMNTPVENEWHELKKPLLTIWGGRARMTKAELMPYTLAKPDARVHIIQQSGILPHVEQPRHVSSAIRDFTRSRVTYA